MEAEAFRAGAAKVDITPPVGTLINGDFITHYATFIHDPLYAKALVLSSGKEVLAIVVADICCMEKDFLDAVKFEIERQTSIPESNIMIASTHAHSTGAVVSALLGAADLPYTKKLPSLIVESVKKAYGNLREATLAFGSVPAPEHVVCRRYRMKDSYRAFNPVSGKSDGIKTNPLGAESEIIRPENSMDTGLSFLAIRDLNGKWISLLGNYSMHYVGDWQPGTISADYFGEFSSRVQQLLDAGDDFVGILTNGTSGDANIWDFMNGDRYPKKDFEKSKLIAGDLAGKAVQALEELSWRSDITLSSAYKEYQVGIRKPSAEELLKAKEIVAKACFEGMREIDNEALKAVYAREQILLAEEADHELFPVQAFKIGEGIIGALGGEFFAETGLWLKKNSPVKSYFTITLANGCMGYVPPGHEFPEGGYETWRCRTSKLAFDAEEKIRKYLLRLMKEL